MARHAHRAEVGSVPLHSFVWVEVAPSRGDVASMRSRGPGVCYCMTSQGRGSAGEGKVGREGGGRDTRVQLLRFSLKTRG